MVSLVNDILDMSRIEAGKIELEDKPFDIRVLADELRNMFQESVEAKDLRFDVELVDFTD
ncbi:MAG: sensor histidine kinase [Coprococcus sp.]